MFYGIWWKSLQLWRHNYNYNNSITLKHVFSFSLQISKVHNWWQLKGLWFDPLESCWVWWRTVVQAKACCKLQSWYSKAHRWKAPAMSTFAWQSPAALQHLAASPGFTHAPNTVGLVSFITVLQSDLRWRLKLSYVLQLGSPAAQMGQGWLPERTQLAIQIDLSHLGFWVLQSHLLCKSKAISRMKEVLDKLPSVLCRIDISGRKHQYIYIHSFWNEKDELEDS